MIKILYIIKINNNEVEKIEFFNSILNTLNSNSINQKNSKNKKIKDNKDKITNNSNNKKHMNRFSLPSKLQFENKNEKNKSNIGSNEKDSSDFSEKNSGIKTKISNIKNEKEKFFFNSFTNLLRINENSFHINSLYENINKITNNKYSKDYTLQIKTKDFLVNQCSILHNSSRKSNKLMLKNPMNGQIVVSKFSTLKSAKNMNLEDNRRSMNLEDLSKLKSKSINDNDSSDNKRSKSSRSSKSSNSESIIDKSKREDSLKVKRYDSYKFGI